MLTTGLTATRICDTIYESYQGGVMARDEEKYKAQKKYYEKNKKRISEKRKEYHKKYYEENKKVIIKRGKEYYSKNKDSVREYSRNQNFYNNYGITTVERDSMYDAQAGCCAICNKYCEKTGRDGLHIDHSHSTNKVRGLLCGMCNRALGNVGEDTAILERMIAYIREYNGS